MKKLYLFLVAMLVSLTVSAADYYLIGGFNDWALKDANCKFTDGGNDVYTLDVAKLTSGFKINDGTWSNDNANFGGNGTLVEGTVFNLTVGGDSGNINISNDIENAHLEFNPTAKTLLITGKSVEAVYTYQIWGEVKTGISNDWQGINLTEENGVWVYTGTLKPGNFGIRQMNGNTQTKWYSASGSNTIGEAQLGVSLPVKVEGTNWSSSLNGNYKFVFDVEALKLTITEAGDEPLPPTPIQVPANLYMIGNLSTGSWNTNNAPAMTKEGNTFSIEGVTIANGGGDGYFSFLTAIGSTWDIVNSSDRYGSATVDEPIVLGEPTAFIKYAVGVNASSAKSWKIAEGTYDVTVNFDDMTVTVTESNVEPTPVIYTYDIWGNIVTGEWSDLQMTEADGVWTGTADIIPGEFGIRKLVDGAQDGWLSAPQGSATIGEDQLGKPLAVAGSVNENFKFTLEGNFTFSFDVEAMTLTVTKNGGDDPQPPTVDVPQTLFIIGNLSVGDWDTKTAPAMIKEGNVFYIDDIEFTNGGYDCYFSFITATGDTWEEVNAHDRYGATTKDEEIELFEITPFKKFEANNDASSAFSWKIPAGLYSITVDFDEMAMIAIPKYDPEPVVITYDIWHGVENGEWSAIPLTEETDGVWTATTDCTPFEFGIRKFKNGNQSAWYSAPQGDATIDEESLNMPLYLANTDNENFKFTLSGNFTFKFDANDMTLTVTKNSDDPQPVMVPETLYLVGNLSTGNWNTVNAPALTKAGNIFTINDVEFVAADGTDSAYFSFITATGSDWDSEVNTSDRYGAESNDAPIEAGVPATLVKYAAGVNASAAASWKVAPGIYNIKVDFDNMTVTIDKPVGINDVDNENVDVEYFDLNGMRVLNPASGNIYIKRSGAKVAKEYIR